MSIFWTVNVAQLTKWTISKPEAPGSYPIVGGFLSVNYLFIAFYVKSFVEYFYPIIISVKSEH